MNPDGFHIPPLDQLLAAFQGSPVGLYLIPSMGLVAGAFLWAAGGRALKPFFVILAMIGGATIGFHHLTPLLAGHIRSFPPHYAGLGFGALGGLLLAVAFFRALMGLAAAVTLAAVAFAIAAASMGLRLSDFTPRPENAGPETSTVAADPAALYERAVVVYGARTPPLVQPETQPRRRAAATLDEPAAQPVTATQPSTVEQVRSHLTSIWSALPERARYNLGAAALAGAVLGLVVGVLAPKKSAALVTASLGAGLMLITATFLIRTLEPGHTAVKLLGILDQRGPGAWLAVWGALAVLGLAIQGHMARKPAPKPEA